MDDLTGFQRDLLFAIASFDKPSGQTVGSEIQEYYETEINYGRLYPNLDTLVEKDLVMVCQQRPVPPVQTCYRLQKPAGGGRFSGRRPSVYGKSSSLSR